MLEVELYPRGYRMIAFFKTYEEAEKALSRFIDDEKLFKWETVEDSILDGVYYCHKDGGGGADFTGRIIPCKVSTKPHDPEWLE